MLAQTGSLDPESQVPDHLLVGLGSAALCNWLCLYVAEARKQDVSIFLLKSLYLLLRAVSLDHIDSKNFTCLILSTLTSLSLLVCTMPWQGSSQHEAEEAITSSGLVLQSARSTSEL